MKKNKYHFAVIEGKRIKTVARIFNKHSKRPEMENADMETFVATM